MIAPADSGSLVTLTGPQIRRCFSRTYQQARERFVEATQQQRGSLLSLTHPERGALGEPLTLDVATWGDPSAPVTLVLSSGLHGIEGFFGSAVQLALLQQLATHPWPHAMRLVLVHALNPWGFSHLRRVDEQNIDCNRNFLLTDAPPVSSAELEARQLYAELNSFLNPERGPRFVDGFFLQAWKLLRRHGHSRLSQAIAAGQSDFPEGLFYSGHQPGWTVQQIEQHWPEWIGSAERIIHFDLHTGLGRRGQGACLLNADVSPEHLRLLQNALGAEHLEQPASAAAPPESASSDNSTTDDSTAAPAVVPYQTRGDWGTWCLQRFGAERYCYGCLEFGTFPAIRVLKNLRLENQAQHFSSPAAPRRARCKRRLSRIDRKSTRLNSSHV